MYSDYSKPYQFSNASATLKLNGFKLDVPAAGAPAVLMFAVATETVSFSNIMSSNAFELMSIFRSILNVIQFSVE